VNGIEKAFESCRKALGVNTSVIHLDLILISVHQQHTGPLHLHKMSFHNAALKSHQVPKLNSPPLLRVQQLARCAKTYAHTIQHVVAQEAITLSGAGIRT
jgi:hypothetical protein